MKIILTDEERAEIAGVLADFDAWDDKTRKGKKRWAEIQKGWANLSTEKQDQEYEKWTDGVDRRFRRIAKRFTPWCDTPCSCRDEIARAFLASALKSGTVE